LHYLMPMLADAERAGKINGEIIIVPAVNPIGQSQLVGNTHLGRYHLNSRDNFNRSWLDLSDAVAERVGRKLGSNPQANVEMIRKAALAALKAMTPVNELQTMRVEIMKLSVDADVVLDLHCDSEAILHVFGSERDLGGTIETLAADLGAPSTMYNQPYPEALTFSGVNGSLWSRLADRFPAAAIPQACFSVTVELRSQHDVTHALGEADATNLFRYLMRRGIVAGDPGPLPKLKSAPTPIAGMDVGYCPVGGFIVYLLAAGAKVKEGQPVCEIIDPTDPRGPQARTPILARSDGLLFSRRRNGGIAWPGMVAFRIAGPKAAGASAGHERPGRLKSIVSESIDFRSGWAHYGSAGKESYLPAVRSKGGIQMWRSAVPAVLAAGGVFVSSVALGAPTFVTLANDNDYFIHQDRHYTAGTHAAFVKEIDDLSPALRDLAPLRWSADRKVALSFGQRLYTPGNLNPKPEEPPDRPFAGWIYLQADIRTQTGASVEHLMANVGYIGPAAGGRIFQKVAHRVLSSRDVVGWERQLRGEPTLTVGYDRSWPGLVATNAGSLTLDVSPLAGAMAGNVYTYANAGLVARIGRNLPDDLPATHITLGPPVDGYRGGSGFGWYVWGGVDARAVARNVFLDGSTFRDSESVERKAFQHDLMLGVVVAWPRARVGLTLVQRSREFDGQDGADRFGSLSVSFAY
jgi:predicted deacylase